MPRRSRRYVVNITLFGLALFLIIYLGAPSSSDSQQPFAWTRIRYRTTTAEENLPGAQGTCPGLQPGGKPALVVARVQDDGNETWLDLLAGKYHLCVFTIDASPPPSLETSQRVLQVPANKGHEAMAYLTFIIDNYALLPAESVFVHGSKFSWHNDHPTYSNLPLLQNLNLSAAVTDTGYHNLRCDWQASTCDPRESKPQGSLEKAVNAKLEPWNARDVSDSKLPGVFAKLFGDPDGEAGRVFLGRSEAVRSQCCAQFVVARGSVHQHEREEYVALRQWLLDDGVAPKDDKISGRILSYLWHVLFIKQDGTDGVDLNRLNDLACPTAEQCYCKLYGRCGLEGCTTPGRCHGQYQIPVDYKLPAGWEEKHG